jgi:hypothetical protein
VNNSLRYNIELGQGVSIKEVEADGKQAAGHVVRIHFYNKPEAVRFASRLISQLGKQNELDWEKQKISKIKADAFKKQWDEDMGI